MSAPPVRVLGAGRAGCSLAAALETAGRSVSLWTRSHHTAEEARRVGFTVETGEILPVRRDEIVLLAVKDDEVPALGTQLAATGTIEKGALVAHLSGALDLSALAPLKEAGVRVGSLHPLLSLASRRSRLHGAAAIASEDSESDRALADLARDAGFTVIRPAGSRALYHAAACVAGNYPQVLLEAGIVLLERCGLSRAEAQRAIAPLFESAVHNALERGPAGGLTGPISRGDAKVVASHLAALRNDPTIETLYRAAGRIAVDLAPISEEERMAVREILQEDTGN